MAKAKYRSWERAFDLITNRRGNMDPASGRSPTMESSLAIAHIGDHEERYSTIVEICVDFA